MKEPVTIARIAVTKEPPTGEQLQHWDAALAQRHVDKIYSPAPYDAAENPRRASGETRHFDMIAEN